MKIANTERTFHIPSSWLEKKLTVVLLGLGGTGSSILTELFQLDGVLKKLGGQGLHVIAYDGDVVSESNLFRQAFWEFDLGLNKAEVLINRLNQFGGIEWEAKPKFCNSEILKGMDFDLLITAVDKASVRFEIGNALQGKDKFGLWLDMGNSEDQSNVILGSISGYDSTGIPLPSPYQLFGAQWLEATKNEDDTPSCSTEMAIQRQTFGVNGMTARSASSMLLFPLLRTGKLKHHGLFIDIKMAEITKMNVDPLQWALYGYNKQK